jgi:hypothetical protein
VIFALATFSSAGQASAAYASEQQQFGGPTIGGIGDAAFSETSAESLVVLDKAAVFAISVETPSGQPLQGEQQLAQLVIAGCSGNPACSHP